MSTRSRRVSALALMKVASIMLLASFSAVRAQNESGTRPLNKKAFEEANVWYNTLSARFHLRYPIIRSLPPLNSGMPWDIMAAYVHLDSVARFDDSRDAAKMLDRWRANLTITDTLKNAVTYLYKLVDYNPITFTQYIDEISLKYRTRYWGSLRTVVSKVGSTLFDALPATTSERRVAMLALLEPSYILRIKVVAIDSMATGYGDTTGKQFYRVTANVLDTLKGRVFPSCHYSWRTDKKVDKAAGIAAATLPCVQFVYTNNFYFNPFHLRSGEPQLYTARDPKFAFGLDSLFRMEVGQEAVVFFDFDNHLIDSSYDYYQSRLEARASFGALPIIDGQVRDINRIWSDDVMLPYADWRQRFMALRDKLLSGTYY